MVKRITVGIGDNSVSEATADKLRSILERLENLDEEMKDLREAKKEVKAEAKAMGFDTKVVNEVYRRLQQDRAEREEFEMQVDAYMFALEERV